MGLQRLLFTLVCVVVAAGSVMGQTALSPFPAATVIPRVVCHADSKQSYALYLPSSFSPGRKWPIIYVFDPAARGEVAVEAVRAAAEKFGYIVAASNNSHNGPMADSLVAANAVWRDTQQRFPVDDRRLYLAGMSGGARLATTIALSCNTCVAGVIANAAGFPHGDHPARKPQFAYFGAVGNADFNYGEFVELRKALDADGARYRIRIFEGQHGWAPPEVWEEALDWMDIQAMSAGIVPRDATRIRETADKELAEARELERKKDWLESLRRYESLVSDFKELTDVSAAENSVALLRGDKTVKVAEKEESSALEHQAQISDPLAARMHALGSGKGDVDDAALRQDLADLKKRADASRSSNELKALVVRRALSGLVIEAYEAGENSLDQKDYWAALIYFDLASAGSASPAWAHYERARVYAIMSEKKNMLGELRLALAGGFHDASALNASEFQPFKELAEFQALAGQWQRAGAPEP
jgi:dienelactone hydrolase